jgi:hypothetical protein
MGFVTPCSVLELSRLSGVSLSVEIGMTSNGAWRRCAVMI